jgi:aminoglycoside phosphotransferase (APT) family kinase protein
VTVSTDIPTRLIGVLRDAAGAPGLEYARPPEPLLGGFWAEIFSFSLASPPDGWPAELVARLMPDPGPARKETVMQTAVAATGFPTPLVRAAGGPDDGLGRAFIVMDKAPGQMALAGLDGGLTPGLLLGLMREMPGLLAGTMARLHALDPGLVRDDLADVHEVPVTSAGMLAMLGRVAGEFGRPDLASAAQWLSGHQPAPSPEVICHGDLHPFNLLITGDQATVLDWQSALLAPRAHDVAFTTLMLSEPPLRVPGWQRRLIGMAGRELARRFARDYQRRAGVRIGAGELRWHQAAACLRALTEVASWEHYGSVAQHAGHPWLIIGPALARRVARVTGVSVRWRSGPADALVTGQPAAEPGRP